MKYQEALEEFVQEEEEGRARLVYAHFGSAVYYGQVIEEALTQMLWMHHFFNQNDQTNQVLNQIIDNYDMSKKTMGKLIREVKKAYSLTTKIETDLTALLNKRNYLVHRYFKDHIAKCFSESGQKEMIEYFCGFCEQIMQMDQNLKPYFANHMNKLNLCDEKIDHYLELMKKEWKS